MLHMAVALQADTRGLPERAGQRKEHSWISAAAAQLLEAERRQ